VIYLAGSGLAPKWRIRSIRTCCDMAAALLWPMPVTTPAPCKLGWGTRTSSIPCAIPSWHQIGSRTSGADPPGSSPQSTGPNSGAPTCGRRGRRVVQVVSLVSARIDFARRPLEAERCRAGPGRWCVFRGRGRPENRCTASHSCVALALLARAKSAASSSVAEPGERNGQRSRDRPLRYADMKRASLRKSTLLFQVRRVIGWWLRVQRRLVHWNIPSLQFGSESRARLPLNKRCGVPIRRERPCYRAQPTVFALARDCGSMSIRRRLCRWIRS
jgi:hypothetical protein